MADLHVQFLGHTVPSPFLLASAPPTAFGENIMRAFDAGWGGAVLKTLKPDGMLIEDARPRFAALRDSRNSVYGFENFELLSKRSLSEWAADIAEIKKRYPDNLLIASIMGDSIRSWQEMARRVQDAGCDMIECNFSCPHGMPEIGAGMAVGQVPEIAGEITATVHDICRVPLLVKLTPNVADPRLVCQAVLDAGADGVTAINTVQCLIGVDLDTFRPQPAVDGLSTYGGYSGKAVKPIGLRVVSQAAATMQERSMRPAVSGVGGISTWQDAAEYMLVGSTTVQLCTEVMLKGFGIIDRLASGLSQYLDAKGFASPMDLVGKSLPWLTSHEALAKHAPVTATVDRDRCTACGACATACADSAYGALAMNMDGDAPRLEINRKRCDGCGLCTVVCKTGALTV
ncbi:NAD-dependent dihydropyrimidine dehydrogenase subunit PreA [Oceanidesulfovibrio marinus]|uniref:dihydrouracil dehydrogenase (NAD(+)) n=1 Tax=Oceanidesulfovibrio marinus TaxID=370038 RepID=A0ABX6NFH3_9BACT|nr:NAD-dependent dihydropyrimidine dehydrogenase subunit PreA [Oceanidesulfovibrio marinus]QJT08350.1 NAD-dependent dihydropyrimidine dehydrogenase subunit PreA [Oceanidesulfovibrio marinus]